MGVVMTVHVIDPLPGLTLEETKDWFFIRDLGMFAGVDETIKAKDRHIAPHLFDEVAPEIQERRRELIGKMNAARRKLVKQRVYDDEIYVRAFGHFGRRKDQGEVWGA